MKLTPKSIQRRKCLKRGRQKWPTCDYFKCLVGWEGKASFLKQSKRAEKRNKCRTEFLLTTVSLDSPNPTLCFTANRWYASLGCWRDTESFAVSPLEGADPLLTEPYLTRQKPIDTCAQVARKHDYKGKLLPFSSSWSGGGGLNYIWCRWQCAVNISIKCSAFLAAINF